MDPRKLLSTISERGRREFRQDQTIRSYSEYLRDLVQEPQIYARSAARFLAEMFEHFGSTEVETSEGTRRRWNLFDAPFEDDSHRPLVGQEYLQNRLYQALRSFAREGATDKILLLHGPNGSGKTTVTDLVFHALEEYSRSPEGILYRYSWVFPTKKVTTGSLGFQRSGPESGYETPSDAGIEDSYAHLDETEVDLRLACELRDHPLFLLPPEDRRTLLEEAYEEAGLDLDGDEGPGPWILEGNLCHKCRQVYDALLTEHRGDLRQVLRHVRVERYFMSRRYRRAAATVHPQLHVDAAEAQVSSDRSLEALPASLQTLTLFTPLGDLIDANGGLLEFSDLLKRPMDLNHYLLNTVEKSRVHLRHSTVHLNLVMVATSNEGHLDAFKRIALWPSFKARMELIAAPYLLEYGREARIYDETVRIMSQRKHVAPHTAELAALWAVLTRLQRPDPERYPSELRSVVREISPLQKALLYDHGETHKALSSEDRIHLRAAREWMRKESYRSGEYEGRTGASPREIKQVLLYALYDGVRKCVTPMDLFAKLESLVSDRSVHEFLNEEPDGPYRNPSAFIEAVRDHFLEILSDEVRASMDLVSVDQYGELFGRYLRHVKAQVAGETIRNPQTGKEEKPDLDLLKEVESVIAGEEDPEEFRGSIISRIGAWRVENPEDTVEVVSLFPELIGRLREDYYGQHEATIEKIQENLLRYGTDDFDALDTGLQHQVEATLENLRRKFGYCEHCAKDTVAFLRRHQTHSSN